jgi:hypothetical protein
MGWNTDLLMTIEVPRSSFCEFRDDSHQAGLVPLVSSKVWKQPWVTGPSQTQLLRLGLLGSRISWGSNKFRGGRFTVDSFECQGAGRWDGNSRSSSSKNQNCFTECENVAHAVNNLLNDQPKWCIKFSEGYEYRAKIRKVLSSCRVHNTWYQVNVVS